MGTIIEHFIGNKSLQPFFDGVDEFCQRHLPSKRSYEEDGGPKTFADPVERYASFASWEVCIIDTPLFQRLRSIRQLGLAYLVYPTLGYSRFEHTIGVTARLDQVFRNLQETRRLETHEHSFPVLPTETQINQCRLACLFHDIGHCLFSHVSESVMDELPGHAHYPATKKIMEEFQEYAGKFIPMAEVLAVSILTSTSFVKFLDRIEVPGKKKNLALAAAHLVMGLPIPGDLNSLYLAQLMSSGLDVDKLDYMLRESHFTGITLGVSLDWLLKKLFIRAVPADQLPQGLKGRVRKFPANSTFAVLGLKRGGQFAFEEFCIARLALHEKIYLHQKIRAAEAAMKHELLQLATHTPHLKEAHRWLFLREAMLEFPDAELPTLQNPDLFYPAAQRAAPKLDLERFKARRLPFRAYGFGWQNTIAEPLTDQPEASGSATDRLVDEIKTNQTLFLDKVCANLRAIQATLEQDASNGAEPLPDFAPAVQILIDLARTSSIQQGHDTIYFERNSRVPLRWTMPIDKIVDYYLNNRALGYLFCEEEFVPYVMLAAEKTVWQCFKAIYVQDGCVNSRSLTKAAKLRDRLHKRAFYEDARELQPVSEYLNSLDAQDAVSRIARKLAPYHPRSKRFVTPAGITTYVSQFPGELQNAALAWLETLQLIPQDIYIQKAIDRVKSLKQTKRFGFCPLGSATDSASRLAYELRVPMGQMFPGDQVLVEPLREALSSKPDAYVIYDDNINSGKQALNIVAAWLGVNLPPDRAIHESHVPALTAVDQTELRSKPVFFVFAVATDGACKRLKQDLVTYCGFTETRVTVESGLTLSSDQRSFSGGNSTFQHAKRMELRNYLVDVAKSIFISEGKSEKRAEQLALGYAGAEAMVVFSHNCPTMTVSALWLTGPYSGKQWYPLVERTRRMDPRSGQYSADDL